MSLPKSLRDLTADNANFAENDVSDDLLTLEI